MPAMDVETRFERVVETLVARDPGTKVGTIFKGSPALLTGDKTFAMLSKGRYVLKLPAERCEELKAQGRGETFTSGKRQMREWVIVNDDEQHDDWIALAEEARDFVARTAK